MNPPRYLATLAALLAGVGTASPVAYAAAPGPVAYSANARPPAPSIAATSIDSLMATIYATVSGDAGAAHDWDALARLHAPGARFYIPRTATDGTAQADVLDFEDFVALNEERFRGRGFHEREVHREVAEFGAIAHVWSVFESRHARHDAKPYARGANSLQLLRTPDGWRVLSVTWAFETPDLPLSLRFPALASASDG